MLRRETKAEAQSKKAIRRDTANPHLTENASSIRRRAHLVIIAWAAIISVIMIKAHWILYQTDEMLRSGTRAFVVYRPASLDIFDMIILLAASMITIVMVYDIKSMVFGFIAAHCISFAVFVSYVSLYIWSVQGFNVYYSSEAFGWEIVAFYGLLHLIYLAFPWVIGLGIVGCLLGLTLRGMLFPTW